MLAHGCSYSFMVLKCSIFVGNINDQNILMQNNLLIREITVSIGYTIYPKGILEYVSTNSVEWCFRFFITIKASTKTAVDFEGS